MTSRIVLPAATAMLAYEATMMLSLRLAIGMSPVSIAQSSVAALFFGCLVTILWLRPAIGGWPVAALLAFRAWVYASGSVRMDGSGSEFIRSATMTALCVALVYALLRTEFRADPKNLPVSSPA
jgi:hypothetical protein